MLWLGQRCGLPPTVLGADGPWELWGGTMRVAGDSRVPHLCWVLAEGRWLWVSLLWLWPPEVAYGEKVAARWVWPCPQVSRCLL